MNLEDGLDFGTVCAGRNALTLQIFNVGVEQLIITSVQRLMGSTGFTVLTSPGTPLVLAPGEEDRLRDHVLTTTPLGSPRQARSGSSATTRALRSSISPLPDWAVSHPWSWRLRMTGTSVMCAGQGFVDRDLVISNRGPCPLEIERIVSSAAEFVPPRVSFYPIVVEAGDSIALPIRFQPSGFGLAAATLTVTSNDPNSPHQVDVTGNAPAPRLVSSIANSGDFGHVCVDDFRDQPLMLSNSGHCPLTIFSVTSSDLDFVAPVVDTFPIVMGPGDTVDVQIRFQPSSFGPKARRSRSTATTRPPPPRSPSRVWLPPAIW